MTTARRLSESGWNEAVQSSAVQEEEQGASAGVVVGVCESQTQRLHVHSSFLWTLRTRQA